MVKGVSRQVIVVKSPDEKLFEQAIFILRADAEGISEEMLMKEARKAVSPAVKWKGFGPAWAAGGAVCTALVWLLTVLL
jgi:hypothetical protein